MIISMSELLRTIAAALDVVEGDLLGASTNHAKRIAALSAAMGEKLGMNESEIFALTACALMHDSALTEYILSERPGDGQMQNMHLHCIYGQRNVEALPFTTSVEGFVLYHHEWADGSGPFKKREGEFPLGAQLIAISDMLDVSIHLQRLPTAELPALRAHIEARKGLQFTRAAAEAMLQVLDEPMLMSLRDDRINETVVRYMPRQRQDIRDHAIVRLAGVTARIIDYKSKFTRRHTVDIANRAWWMAGYYGMDEELRSHVYLAAALHDLGKLLVPTEILEKPGKLTDEEFAIIKRHARDTREMLMEVKGMEVIREWAANHHEMLNGSGYSLGLGADELDRVSRLLACVDIYQAVSELRPYHPARTHTETMPILYEMVKQGKLDQKIVEDLDRQMIAFEGRELPRPEGAVAFPDGAGDASIEG